jgi:hypothetical protein
VPAVAIFCEDKRIEVQGFYPCTSVNFFVLLLLGYFPNHTFDEPVEGEKRFVGHNLTFFHA